MLTEEDKKLIVELGLGDSPEEQQAEQLAQFYHALEIHISLALEDELTDEQLAEFEKVHDAGDDAATKAWVQQAVPRYDEIVAVETASLKQSFVDTAAQLKKAIDESK
jgi:Protein of unknown function (DUF5663)